VTTAPEELLARATRCALAARGADGPDVAPMVFWWDGAALWMAASAARVHAAGLRGDPRCAVYVPPLAEGEPGAVAHGSARVYSLDDPVGLVLHTPVISAAMAALAARNAGSLLGYVRDAPHLPHRWWPGTRVVLRVPVEHLAGVEPPAVAAGVAPALPTVVPADVRRAVAGARRLVLAYADGDLQVTPAVWAAGYRLTTPPALRPPPGVRAAATLDVASTARPRRAVGVTVLGTIAPDGHLRPERVTSWHGFDTATVAVPRPTAGGVTLPD